ncbi:MAG TPA: hypothetical protein VGL92_10985, partial [Acidimicrobiia bacterium]
EWHDAPFFLNIPEDTVLLFDVYAFGTDHGDAAGVWRAECEVYRAGAGAPVLLTPLTQRKSSTSVAASWDMRVVIVPEGGISVQVHADPDQTVDWFVTNTDFTGMFGRFPGV